MGSNIICADAGIVSLDTAEHLAAAGGGVKIFKLLAAVATVATVLTLSAGHAGASTFHHHSPRDCSGGSDGCTTPKTLFEDRFNRDSRDSVGNDWYGYEHRDSDVSISHDKLKLGAKSPKTYYNSNPDPNWSWAIQNIDIPDCCAEEATGRITISFDFVSQGNTADDDFLWVSWQAVPPNPTDGVLDHVLQKYTLGGSDPTSAQTVFQINFDSDELPQTIALAFAIEVGGCGTTSCIWHPPFEYVKLDNVKAVLDCVVNPEQIPEAPLPGALPLFVSGAGVFGMIGWRRKKRMAKQSGANA